MVKGPLSSFDADLSRAEQQLSQGDEYPGVREAFKRDFGVYPPTLKRKEGKTAIDDLKGMRVIDTIEVGQQWHGSDTGWVGSQIVEVLKISRWKKGRKITVKKVYGLSGGEVTPIDEAQFRGNFTLYRPAPPKS